VQYCATHIQHILTLNRTSSEQRLIEKLTDFLLPSEKLSIKINETSRDDRLSVGLHDRHSHKKFISDQKPLMTETVYLGIHEWL
jgi:hypothetical protein